MMTCATTSSLPKFIVLGQGKSGTSLIYRVLSRNPLVGLSIPKELHFFNANFGKGVQWYAQHFAHLSPDEQLIGEVSPSYLTTKALHRIATLLGQQTKVIFVLRRPIEHAFSRYLQNICADQRAGPFPRIDQALPKRLENLQQAIRTAFDLFGPTNVLPLFFEKDIACQDPTFEAQILNFIGLPYANYGKQHLEGTPVNPGTMPRYLYSGEGGLRFWQSSQLYEIPAHHLVFCGQQRNSWVKKNPDTVDLVDALRRQSTWTSAISRKEYRGALERSVLPVADSLSEEFGFDLSHWKCQPQRIAYDVAPPPDTFLASPAVKPSEAF